MLECLHDGLQAPDQLVSYLGYGAPWFALGVLLSWVLPDSGDPSEGSFSGFVEAIDRCREGCRVPGGTRSCGTSCGVV